MCLLWNSVSPAVTSQMTSPPVHRHHQRQQQMLTRRDDEDDERSLSTPPLPFAAAADQRQYIKDEPASPSSASRHPHVTCVGHCQGQGQPQGQGQVRDAAAASPSDQRQFEGRRVQGLVQGQTQVQGRETCVQGHSYVQGQTQGQGREASMTSLLGDDTGGRTSPMSVVAAAAATSASSASSALSAASSVFESDLSADAASVPAKQARLALTTCAATWQPLR